MSQQWIAIVGTLTIFAVERLLVALLTGSPRRIAWVRATWWLHPNAISFMRMPMGLVSLGMWLANWQLLAFFWFAFWMITDLTDGNIARACDLGTESGKWIDPLSDKLLYFPVLLFFAIGDPRLPWPWIIALVVIDTVGQLSRLVARKKAANSFGKGKTALITVLIILVGLDSLHNLPFVDDRFLSLLTVSCTILAFLSVYCKVVPDIWYANTFTLANFLCGTAAIYSVYQHRLLQGFVLIFLGQFFDLFDGRMARKFGSTRRGALFDDIADGTSFGLATAFLIFVALGSSPLAFAVAAFFCACVIFRLIRFLRTRDLPLGIFEGLPSPAGALLAGSAVLLFDTLLALGHAVTLLAAMLMVSHIRYRHVSHSIWASIPGIVRISLAVATIVFVSKNLAGKWFQQDFLSVPLAGFGLALLYVIGMRAKRAPPP